ncbi:hypothetical protein SDC9_86663 [bioreactor metagenome]|uniref:Uncharacterized protein n=1 Tax=bioreactor metagenome TaxID=1076179 RepID=A0A644ZGK7_9ZZZZ
MPLQLRRVAVLHGGGGGGARNAEGDRRDGPAEHASLVNAHEHAEGRGGGHFVDQRKQEGDGHIPAQAGNRPDCDPEKHADRRV